MFALFSRNNNSGVRLYIYIYIYDGDDDDAMMNIISFTILHHYFEDQSLQFVFYYQFYLPNGL